MNFRYSSDWMVEMFIGTLKPLYNISKLSQINFVRYNDFLNYSVKFQYPNDLLEDIFVGALKHLYKISKLHRFYFYFLLS
jgi:hypothetical protein